MASFWERKVVAVRVFFLSFYYPLISILTLHILTTYCATEMKGFPQHPLDGSFSIFFLSVLMFSLLITMGLRQSSAYTVLQQHGFLNKTVYFGTLVSPFSTKSLLRLHGFLLTQLFFQSLKKQRIWFFLLSLPQNERKIY